MFLLSKVLRWVSPRLPRELYDCANGHMFILYTYLTHVGGLVDANVTFYLVETFISMNVQRPVAIGADKVNTWVIFRELSILYIM